MKKQKVTKEQEQWVFNGARKEIEIGLGLTLSLIELVELRYIWVPKTIKDWEKTKAYSYSDFSVNFETAARFISANYTSDRIFIEDVFGLGMYPPNNSPEREYLRIKQDQMHLL